MNRPVTVIIPNYNGKNLLSGCLQGLRNQRYEHFLTVLVDNGSKDDSVGFVREKFPEVRLIALPENVGFAAACNAALRAVDTPYAALLNNDAVPHAGWLQTLVQALENHPEAGFAASKMLLSDHPERIDRAGDAYTRAGTGFLRGYAEPADRYHAEEWIFGACAGAAMYRTSMFDDIGLFDEDFFLLYEDVDLGFRAQLKGYPCLFVPDAIVYHKGSTTLIHDSPVSVYYSHRNLEWVYLKNMPTGLFLRTLLPHMIYGIGSFLYFLFHGRARIFFRAKQDAFKGLNRILEKRRSIQVEKRVDNRYIWSLMQRERFVDRISRRTRKRRLADHPETRDG